MVYDSQINLKFSKDNCVIESVYEQTCDHFITGKDHTMVFFLKLIFFFQILQCGGNLYDVISLASKAALYDTRLEQTLV